MYNKTAMRHLAYSKHYGHHNDYRSEHDYMDRRMNLGRLRLT